MNNFEYDDLYYEAVSCKLSSENEIWHGKPNKICFILNTILGPGSLFLMIFSILLLKINLNNNFKESKLVAINILVVIIYFLIVFFALKDRNRYFYMITDQALYIYTTTPSINADAESLIKALNNRHFERIHLNNLIYYKISKSLYDNIFKTGTIKIKYSNNNREIDEEISNIKDCDMVFNLIKYKNNELTTNLKLRKE